MPGTENKVQFNLKNVHYAILNAAGSNPTWETPVKVPGAVSLSLDPQGDVSPFYADGIVYYQTIANNGYSGDLEMARFPDQMIQEVWGAELVPTDEVLLERNDIEAKAFALLFQIDGDVDQQLYCLYNCSGTRPGVSGSTTTKTRDPQTQKSTISAVSLETGYIMARTTAKTPDSVRSSWFSTVYVKGGSANG